MRRLLLLVVAGILLTSSCQALTVTLEGQAAIEYLENQGLEIRVVDNWGDLVQEEPESVRLSRQNKCSIQPQLYCCTRYKDKGQEFGHDISELGLGDSFSANTIQRQLDIGKKNYGIYFKITPSWADDGFEINRLDFVFIDPKGNPVYSLGFDTDIVCQDGYFISWNFINLMEMFREQVREKGSVTRGKYVLDVYFNEKWAGDTYFKVGK